MNDKHYLILIVENNTGVLTRISSLFCQRGFNIDSLTVASTDHPGLSRITVVFSGNERTYQQLVLQTSKLIETKMVIPVEPEFGILRELLLLKIETTPDNADQIRAIAENNHFRIIDQSRGCMILEMTGAPKEIDLMLGLFKPFKTLELCRTGVTALERGKVTYCFDN